jgi:molybdenum cofactor guanylyltransferase
LDVSCIVLAGGKSTRLGRNKAFETIGEKSLLARAVSSLASFNSEIIIVVAKESSLPELVDYQRLKIVRDIFSGKGSLGGIYTGLVDSKSFYNIVVACDMPFLSPDLLHYMVDQAENYDIVIPKINETLEPLHSVYSKRCIPSLKYLIEQNRLSILELIPMVKIRYIQDEEIDRFDPEHLSFFNINTETDLRSGIELVRKEDFNGDKRRTSPGKSFK